MASGLAQKPNTYYNQEAPGIRSRCFFSAKIPRGGIPNDKLTPSSDLWRILIAEVLCAAIQLIFRSEEHEDS